MSKKYLKFERVGASDMWSVINIKKHVLGDIRYDDRWKKYKFYICVTPFDDDNSIYFDSKCLQEIAKFMESLQ